MHVHHNAPSGLACQPRVDAMIKWIFSVEWKPANGANFGIGWNSGDPAENSGILQKLKINQFDQFCSANGTADENESPETQTSAQRTNFSRKCLSLPQIMNKYRQFLIQHRFLFVFMHISGEVACVCVRCVGISIDSEYVSIFAFMSGQIIAHKDK